MHLAKPRPRTVVPGRSDGQHSRSPRNPWSVRRHSLDRRLVPRAGGPSVPGHGRFRQPRASRGTMPPSGATALNSTRTTVSALDLPPTDTICRPGFETRKPTHAAWQALAARSVRTPGCAGRPPPRVCRGPGSGPASGRPDWPPVFRCPAIGMAPLPRTAPATRTAKLLTLGYRGAGRCYAQQAGPQHTRGARQLRGPLPRQRAARSAPSRSHYCRYGPIAGNPLPSSGGSPGSPSSNRYRPSPRPHPAGPTPRL